MESWGKRGHDPSGQWVISNPALPPRRRSGTMAVILLPPRKVTMQHRRACYNPSSARVPPAKRTPAVMLHDIATGASDWGSRTATAGSPVSSVVRSRWERTLGTTQPGQRPLFSQSADGNAHKSTQLQYRTEGLCALRAIARWWVTSPTLVCLSSTTTPLAHRCVVHSIHLHGHGMHRAPAAIRM